MLVSKVGAEMPDVLGTSGLVGTVRLPAGVSAVKPSLDAVPDGPGNAEVTGVLGVPSDDWGRSVIALAAKSASISRIRIN